MDAAELNRVFRIFDRNGDDHITKKELKDSLQNLGIFIPDQDLSQMIANNDSNGDDFLDIDEFGVLYQSIVADYEGESEEKEDMREVFKVFDQDGDGFITVDELGSVLSSLGIKQGKTTEDCRLMIMKVDGDGDGRVDFKEFVQRMKKGGLQTLG